jgi:MtN3 and saliva related transmembrane protein
MSLSDVLGIVVTIYGVGMGCAPLLQIRQMLRTRSSRDVSLGFFVVFAVGQTLWLIYGLMISSVPIAVPNAAGLVITLPTLVVATRLRRAETAATLAALAEAEAATHAAGVIAEPVA